MKIKHSNINIFRKINYKMVIMKFFEKFKIKYFFKLSIKTIKLIII